MLTRREDRLNGVIVMRWHGIEFMVVAPRALLGMAQEGLADYVRGWMGYFGLASQLKLFDKLDQWIRLRNRMSYWKQWRRPKRRREMLIRLGVPRRQAIRHAPSRKSYWHMSKTIASGVGLTNAWLAEQGLLSLKTLWAKLAHLR